MADLFGKEDALFTPTGSMANVLAVASLVGPGQEVLCEASAHMAMMIGRSYSIVTTLPRSVPAIEDRLVLSGLAARCASVRANGMSTLQVVNDPAGAIPHRLGTHDKPPE